MFKRTSMRAVTRYSDEEAISPGKALALVREKVLSSILVRLEKYGKRSQIYTLLELGEIA